MNYKVSVVIEKDDNGFYAYSPELDGCQSQGDNFEEVMVNIKEAIEVYMETLSEAELKEVLSTQIISTNVEVKIV